MGKNRRPFIAMKTLRLLLLTCALAILGTPAFAQTTVSITAPDGSAGEKLAGQAANPGIIRIARTGSTAGALTVFLKSISGTAVRGTDYEFGIPLTSWVAIPAGSSSVDIAVNVIDDGLTEGNETVRIDLDSETPSGGLLPYTISGGSRATVTIADNEDPLAPLRAILSVAAVDAVATESPAGTDAGVFRITRTNNLAPAVNVLYALGGTAAQDVDYTSPPATITIPAGAAFVDVPIAPIDDPFVESPETVTFTLLPTDIAGVPPPPEAYAVDATAGVASVTIVSDDLPPAPVVTITAPAANATAASGRPVAVNFTASAVDGYIVSYTVLNGATTVASGPTNLPASTPAGTPYLGTASVTFFGSGSFATLSVRVTNSIGTTATSATRAVYVYVAQPDPPLPPVLPIINLYPLDADGAEVAAGAPDVASFRVTHNFPATAAVSFLFEIKGTAREGVDYSLSSAGTMGSGLFGRWFTFPAGTTETTIVVNPIDDLLLENTETVILSLFTPFFNGFNEGGPNTWEPGTFGFYYGPNFTATVNILNDDTTPPPFPVIVIAATDPVGAEIQDGSDPVVFTITRTSGPTDVPLTVNYALTSVPPPYPYIYPLTVMARNGVDFPTLPGTVTIPSGATSVDIVVVATFDLLKETNEALQLTLRPSATVWPDPAGYVLDENIVATATIHDATLAPGTPVVWIRATDTQAVEDPNTFSRTASLTVERNAGLTVPLTVAYSVSGTATNGVDYTTLPGTVTIPAGSPRIQIIVDPIADGVVEGIESVGITLQLPSPTPNPPPYVLGNSLTMQRSAGVSIRDMRPPPAQLYINRLRNGHFIVPRPTLPGTTAAIPPPPPAVPAEWVVEASGDLTNWQEIGTVVSSEATDEFVDVNAGDFAQRFYRFRPLVPATP